MSSYAIVPVLVLAVVAASWTLRRRRKRIAHRLCRFLPKVDLHYHLHGSIRPTTFLDFAKTQNLQVDETQILRSYRTLAVCFSIFSDVHKLVNSEVNLRRLVRESLEDLWLDNVRYAEIRTTPKALSDATPEKYVSIIIDEISRFSHISDHFAPGKLYVKLILSVDRGRGLDAAWETLAIARNFQGQVVGLDFGGNPFKGKFSTFRNFFEKAREYFPCTIHAAEILDEKDTDCILNFRPDRLGNFLLVTHKQFAAARKMNIPIEVCPTSNLKTLEIPGFKEHPTLDRLIKSNRLSINTDDTGVFMTSLSAELERLAIELSLSFDDLVQLQRNSINMSFLPESMKELLTSSLEEEFDQLRSIA